MKKIIFAVLILITLSLTVLPVFAEPVPEINVIGETLEIEPEDNIIKRSVIAGDPDVSREEETDRVIIMDKKTYVKKCILPVIALVLIGVAVFTVGELGAKCRKKR